MYACLSITTVRMKGTGQGLVRSTAKSAILQSERHTWHAPDRELEGRSMSTEFTLEQRIERMLAAGTLSADEARHLAEMLYGHSERAAEVPTSGGSSRTQTRQPPSHRTIKIAQ